MKQLIASHRFYLGVWSRQTACKARLSALGPFFTYPDFHLQGLHAKSSFHMPPPTRPRPLYVLP